jgi:hypothetical protein
MGAATGAGYCIGTCCCCHCGFACRRFTRDVLGMVAEAGTGGPIV